MRIQPQKNLPVTSHHVTRLQFVNSSQAPPVTTLSSLGTKERWRLSLLHEVAVSAN